MFKIVYRYIINNKKSSFGVILGIIISTMLMFSMIQISGSYMSSFKSFINSTAPQDFYVIDLSYDELNEIDRTFKSMQKNKPDKYLSTIFIGDMYYDKSKQSVVIGYDGDLDYFKKTSLISGKYPDSDNEVCIEESYLNLHPEIKINDSLTLNMTLEGDNDKTCDISHEFKICGIIKDTVENVNVFYTSLKTADNILSENNISNNMSNAITVTADENDLNADKIVEAITVIQNIVVVDKSELKYFNKTQCIMNDEKSLNYEEKGSFESVSTTIFMLSLIIAICLAIFVYNSVSLSFIRKINVFGTMRCIGLSNKKLIWLILSEQFILVSSGAFCGMACGALLNLAIAEKIMSALFSTSAVMEIDQSIKTYVVTYLLTLISAFFACLKLILKIRKTNPININIFNTVKKHINTKNTISKNFLFNLAIRSVKRNFSKSVIQTITLIVSFTLCLVICNFFAVIGVDSVKDAVDFSDYYIQADIADITLNNRYFSEEDLETLRSMDNIDKVYTEKCLTDYVWDKQGDSALQVLIYDDDLLQKFAEINDIKYDSAQQFSVFISKNEYADETFNIYSNENDNKFTVNPNVRLKSANSLNYAIFHQKNTLIVNEKFAESKGINNVGYCTFLVKTDSTTSELLDIPFSAEKVYVTNFHDGQSDTEAQLLGMIVMAIYIVITTVILSFMIISNTIKENMIAKKTEYGVMRAIGLNLKKLWTVVCYENLILTLIACTISVPVSLLINVYLTLILFEKIKISIVAYLILIILLTGLITFFSYFNIKTNTKDTIVEMIHEKE